MNFEVVHFGGSLYLDSIFLLLAAVVRKEILCIKIKTMDSPETRIEEYKITKKRRFEQIPKNPRIV